MLLTMTLGEDWTPMLGEDWKRMLGEDWKRMLGEDLLHLQQQLLEPPLTILTCYGCSLISLVPHRPVNREVNTLYTGCFCRCC
jgi:hypothetical protein